MRGPHVVYLYWLKVLLHMFFDLHYQSISTLPVAVEYFNGTYNLRLPLPKTSLVWDVKVLFENFKKLMLVHLVKIFQESYQAADFIIAIGCNLLKIILKHTV